MHISEKRKLWRVALLLRNEAAISPQAVEVKEQVQSTRSGGRAFLEWALDFLDCAGEHRFPLACYYLDEEAFCIPPRLLGPARRFWKEVRRKKLHSQGIKIINLLF